MDNSKLIRILSEYSGVQEADITLDSRLDSDLGLNSLDFVTLLCDIEQEYNIKIDDSSLGETFSSTYTVGELISILETFS